MFKKIIITINLTLSALIFSQSYNVEINNLNTQMLSLDWFSSFNIVHELLDKYPEHKQEIVDKYMEIYDNYLHFENVNTLINSTLISTTNSSINITNIDFNGGGGCIAYIPVNIRINIQDDILIQVNNNIKKVNKVDYSNYIEIFQLLIENCYNDEYGIFESTGDLFGTLTIKYQEKNITKIKKYKLTFGYIENVYMYLGMYSVLHSADL